jgi:hypothetical protein
MMSGKVVNEPCPISAAGDTMLMVPSVAIVTQTLGANGASVAAASPVASGAMVRVSVSPAVSFRKSRRLRCVFMAQASRAARWMALMMRRYVPQRQRLPSMCSTISSREGFLLRVSSAAACMICPDWQ